MRARAYLSLLSLAAAASTAAASVAAAQPGRSAFVCRDGARVFGRNPSACAGHHGFDARATQALRDGVLRRDAGYQAGRYPDGQRTDGVYDQRRTDVDSRGRDARRDETRRDDRRDARRDDRHDDRQNNRHERDGRP